MRFTRDGFVALLLVLGACDAGGDAAGTEPPSSEGTTSGAEGPFATEPTSTLATEPTDTTDTLDTTDTTDSSGGETICGDGVIAGDEVCDGAALGGLSCASQGFVDGGSLACTASCTVDVSGCDECSDWIRQLGTADLEEGLGIALDGAANVFVVGGTGGSLDGNVSAGNTDAFITKYTPGGAKLWTRTLGSAENDTARGVAVASSDAIYVVGRTSGDLEGNTSLGLADIFVTRLDAEGNRLWTSQYGTALDDEPNGVAVDSLGNIYVVGATWGALEGNTASGEEDVFVTKFDAGGNRLWTRQFGTSATDIAHGVAVDANDDIFVVGATGGVLAGAGFGGTDIFIAKLDGEGTDLWLRQFGAEGSEYGRSIAVDAGGNALITGRVYGTLDVDPSLGGMDIFVSKVDGGGTRLWTRQLGTEYDDFVFGISATSDGGYYLGGGTRGQFEGNTQQGLVDPFFSRFTGDGVELWTQQFGTDTMDILGAVAVDAADHLYATGATLGPLGGESAGAYDMFMFRYCDE